jgi:excisionase family DNA binding protein
MYTEVTFLRKTWSLSETAQSLGVSVAFLRKQIREGQLAPTRLGRRVLIKDEELTRYLNEGSGGV